MRHGISVDPMCRDLAEHMLKDVKDATWGDRLELAELIQQLCDDFCDVHDEDEKDA